MQNPVFRVYVNQVEVGALPEQEYRAIVAAATHTVKDDRRLYLAQAFNLVGCIYRLAKGVALLMPLLLFFAGVAGVLAAPGVMADTLTALRQATPTEVIDAMRIIVGVFGGMTIVSLALAACFTGHGFGYINQFKSAISERISLRIRAILEVAADGDVEVHVGKGFRL